MTGDDEAGNTMLKMRALTDGLVMDDYIYLPGGHWVPKTCLSRWKVRDACLVFSSKIDHGYLLHAISKHVNHFLFEPFENSNRQVQTVYPRKFRENGL